MRLKWTYLVLAITIASCWTTGHVCVVEVDMHFLRTMSNFMDEEVMNSFNVVVLESLCIPI